MKFKKIYIEITNICNKNCSFCSKSKREKKEMTVEEFALIAKEVKKYTDYVFLHIKGEPLLHSKIADIFRICEENNLSVNLTTNGSLIDKNEELLKNSKCLRQINISTHALTTEEEIEKILESIIRIQKYRAVYVVYRYWTMNDKFVLKDNIILNKISKFYLLSDLEKEKIVDEKNIKINNYTYINKDYEFTWPSLDNKIDNEVGFCYGLKTHIGILSDGTVVPCCLDAEGIISLGNIFTSPLSKILSSNRTQKMISNFKDNKRYEELCKHCSFKK